MGTSTKSNDDGSNQAIDIRIFFAVITAAMATAFGVGIALGPSPQLIPANPSAALSSFGSPPTDILSNSNSPSEEEAIQTARRSKTKHSSEIGAKLELDERHVNFQKPVLEDFGDGSGARFSESKSGVSSFDVDDEEHLPAGQHLLVDLANVSAEFLNSETRLADAMVTSVLSAGLTMLSYHCHSLLPAGVSCVGVLLESHISFHTWPEEGVITLDLFTCGPKPLLPAIGDLERLFGIPRMKKNSDGELMDEEEEIISQWSHELRGFRNANSESAKKNAYLDNKSDLAVHIISPLLFGSKTQIVSVNSPFQRIDVWDFLPKDKTPSYQDALEANLTAGDPRWHTDEVASADRYLFLDGKMQSMKEGQRELHETIVHPAMIAHPNPKHVAVIGGGEGASLREILKHETVESVTVIERDEMLVDIAREHLPYMNDCSSIVGLADNCFDDEKTSLIFEDAVQWFKDRYGPDASKAKTAVKFDVIIMDAFEPEDQDMYKDLDFFNAIFDSLSEEGVIGMFFGKAYSIHDPKPDLGFLAPREKFLNLLEAHPSTEAMIIYEEAHCGYDEPQEFLTICKSASCRSRWYEQPVAIDDEISSRVKRTKTSESSLINYDGATHHSYQMTPKGFETVYCRREPTPFECAYRGLDLTMELHEMGEGDDDKGSFEIKTSTIGGEEVKTVYATVDIPKGSYIMPSDVAASMTLRTSVIDGLKSNTQVKETGDVTVIEKFLDFVDDNGHISMLEGSQLTHVEVGATTFIRKSGSESEVNVGRWMPEHPSGKMPVFSPVYERRSMSLDVFIVATRDIKAGEEIVKPFTM